MVTVHSRGGGGRRRAHDGVLAVVRRPPDGTVSGTLGGAEVAPLTITYADGGAPRYGAVEFDTATGGYVYTPNLAGRLRAGVGHLVDSFTVIVTGSDASRAVVRRDVPVSGATLNAVSDPIAVGVRPVGVAVSPDGATIFVADAHTGGVYVLDTGAAALRFEPIVAGGYDGPADYRGPDGGLAFSPDGTLLYVRRQHAEIVAGLFMPAAGDIVVIGNDPADPETYLKVVGEPIDAHTAALRLGGVELGPPAFGSPLSSDGSVAYAGNAGSGTISVIDVMTDEEILDFSHGAAPSSGDVSVLAVSPDGTTLIVADHGSDTVSAITLS